MRNPRHRVHRDTPPHHLHAPMPATTNRPRYVSGKDWFWCKVRLRVTVTVTVRVRIRIRVRVRVRITVAVRVIVRVRGVFRVRVT